MNNCYTEYFLGLLSQTLLFHWCTPKYSHHLAIDKLYGRLQDKSDRFIEVYLAKFNKQPVNNFNIEISASSDCDNIFTYYEAQKENLKKIKTALNKPQAASGLQGIVDDIISDIDQCIYLLRLE
jgi:hypothetical protein